MKESKTKLITVEGVILVVPISYFPPYDKLDEFPDCCGPGQGLWEKLIPDKLLGLRISAA